MFNIFKTIHPQVSTRKKYQRVRCPYCNAISRVQQEQIGGLQLRLCRNGHTFMYDYLQEIIHQQHASYKIPVK